MQAAPSVTHPEGWASRGHDEDVAQHGPPLLPHNSLVLALQHHPLPGAMQPLELAGSLQKCLPLCLPHGPSKVWLVRHAGAPYMVEPGCSRP